MPGKQGLTAFINTNLNESLQKQHIKDLAFAGTVCLMCIDSTWWTAFDKGYNVTLLSDCVSGKTVFELTFNCENVFPLYPKRMLAQCYIKELSG
jgi:nicotinamidase-related amidase